MRNGISSRASCWACNALAGLFLSPVYSKEMMTMAVNTVCTSFRLQSPRVCSGIVDSFKVSYRSFVTLLPFVQLTHLCNTLPTCCCWWWSVSHTLHGSLVLHLLISYVLLITTCLSVLRLQQCANVDVGRRFCDNIDLDSTVCLISWLTLPTTAATPLLPVPLSSLVDFHFHLRCFCFLFVTVSLSLSHFHCLVTKSRWRNWLVVPWHCFFPSFTILRINLANKKNTKESWQFASANLDFCRTHR